MGVFFVLIFGFKFSVSKKNNNPLFDTLNDRSDGKICQILFILRDLSSFKLGKMPDTNTLAPNLCWLHAQHDVSRGIDDILGFAEMKKISYSTFIDSL